MRTSGILVPVTSLPNSIGIGGFGSEAFEMIDYIDSIGSTMWQILPLNPLGYGNSPYQPYSSIAMDEIYICLDKLKTQGLIKGVIPKVKTSSSVNYDEVRTIKQEFLKEAYTTFSQSQDANDKLTLFIKENEWVTNFAVFMTFKKANDLQMWTKWPTEQKMWIVDKKLDSTPYEEEINYQIFIQYILKTQWLDIKTYANSKGVKLVGDIPIYVGIDSVDVWENQKCFLLDNDGTPTFIAGVPPDYFSKTGQRWGNPLYDWDYLEANNFDFWINRLAKNQELFDIIRIDHFRAFDTYWKIPVSCETAMEGAWIEAPGYKLFDTIYDRIPDIDIIAEDLGDLRKEVLELRDHFNLKGMKIIQFSFDPNENNNDFEDRENMVAYTGTHDNQTIVGWFDNQDEETKEQIMMYFDENNYTGALSEMMIELALQSIAEIAIIPIQDILRLNDEARINTPGTIGTPNWEWKLESFEPLNERSLFFKSLIKKHNR